MFGNHYSLPSSHKNCKIYPNQYVSKHRQVNDKQFLKKERKLYGRPIYELFYCLLVINITHIKQLSFYSIS
jgi:hypothetical protein